MGPNTPSSALATTAMVSIAFLLIGGSSIGIGIGGVAAGDKIEGISKHCLEADCKDGYFCMGFNKPENGKAMANEKDKCNVEPSTSNCEHAWVTFKRVGLTDEFDVELIGKVLPKGWVGVGFDPNGHKDPKESKETPFGIACLTETEGEDAVKLIRLPETTGKPVEFMDNSPHHHISDVKDIVREDPWAVCTFKLKLPLWEKDADGNEDNTKPIKYIYDFYTNPTEGVAKPDADGKEEGTITAATIKTDSGMPNDDLSRLNVNATGSGTTTPGGGSGGGDSGAGHLALLPGLLIFGAVSVISFSLFTHDP